MKLLNVGCGPPGAIVPRWYKGWDIVRLDIEAQNRPDLCMDALDLDTLAPCQYDSVYISHLLEHIYQADFARFLGGIQHVLVADGWAYIRVPNLLAACQAIVNAGRVDAFCYDSPAGPITAIDMLYGYQRYVARFGKAMAHRIGFSKQSLGAALRYHGFPTVYLFPAGWELQAVACKTDLNREMKVRMGIERATGEDRPVHPDLRRPDVGAIRRLWDMAELPLQLPSRDPGDGDPPAEAAPRGSGAKLPRAAGFGG